LDRHYKYEKERGKLGTLQEFADSPYFEVAVGEELERYHLLLKELAESEVWATPETKKDLDSLLAEDHKGIVVDLSIVTRKFERSPLLAHWKYFGGGAKRSVRRFFKTAPHGWEPW
jgi:hypothetical protein